MKFVIARPLVAGDESSLCIYTYFSEIQTGSKKDAKDLLEYARTKADTEVHAKEYSIYKVKFKKVE